MSAAKPDVAPAPQSAAAPSPFPPIAEYAFLSNCHTGALIAPDGAIDWLCVPRFDAPSVFGSLLDRGAGNFRLGPFGLSHPVSRAYEPGTNMLETTWRSTGGWVVVRDALTMGPRRHEDTITPHTRPPADDDADHMLVRTVECVSGSVEVELVCEPVFDYGREPAEWSLVGDDRHVADASGAGQTIRLKTDMALGIEGNRVRATCSARARGSTARCRGRRSSPAPRTSRTRRRGSPPRRASGATGSTGPASPTTSGAGRSNAPPWRSRA
jgi:GH15 family glucan-1,4-alpha-glucosidase